jgi:hypothetical protein
MDEIIAFYRPRTPPLNSPWPEPLVAAGRAVGHVRLAIGFVGETDDYDLAIYHAQAGVAAAYTAIDTAAVFLNFWLELGCESKATRERPWPEPQSRIDFARDDFRALVRQAVATNPSAGKAVDQLITAMRKTKPYRDRALHRDGLRLSRRGFDSVWIFRSRQWIESRGDKWIGPMGTPLPRGGRTGTSRRRVARFLGEPARERHSGSIRYDLESKPYRSSEILSVDAQWRRDRRPRLPKSRSVS